MSEFCKQANAVSRVSYQAKIGFGFGASENFRMQLTDEALKGKVCGFVLMYKNSPVSYVFCRIDRDIVTYSIPGYDPGFDLLSPGTVLLYLIIEKLFSDRRYRLFDFGGHEWSYKAFFATGKVDYIKIIWVPATVRNVLLVTAHYVLQRAWQGAAFLKTCSKSGRYLTTAYLPGPGACPTTDYGQPDPRTWAFIGGGDRNKRGYCRNSVTPTTNKSKPVSVHLRFGDIIVQEAEGTIAAAVWHKDQLRRGT